MKVAQTYDNKIEEINKHGFVGSPYSYMHGNLSFIITKITEMKAKGAAAKVDI